MSTLPVSVSLRPARVSHAVSEATAAPTAIPPAPVRKALRSNATSPTGCLHSAFWMIRDGGDSRPASSSCGFSQCLPGKVLPSQRRGGAGVHHVSAAFVDAVLVYFVGRLGPLVDEVLPEVRGRLDRSLPAVPEIRPVQHLMGLSTAQGAVYACLTIAQERLRDAVLGARRQNQPAEHSAPAF